MSFIKIFLKGSRPATLSAVVMPCLMSGAWFYFQKGFLDKYLFILTILSGLCLQIAANFFNDALDFQRGLDTRSSFRFQRITGSLGFSPQKVMALGWAAGGLACVLALPLILKAGWVILLLGVLSLFLAYLYSGSRYALNRQGLSEFICVLFFGFGACFGTYYIQSQEFDLSLIYLSLQCGFWSLSILLINYLRDEEEDKKSGRKNFVTIYGRNSGIFTLCFSQLLIYLICFYWMNFQIKGGAFSFFVSLPSSVLLSFVAMNPPSQKYNMYLLVASGLYVLFSSLWLLGFFV